MSTTTTTTMMVGTKTTRRIGRTSSRRGRLLLSKKRKEETRGVVRNKTGVVTRFVVAFGGDDFDDVGEQEEEEEEGQQKLLRAQQQQQQQSSSSSSSSSSSLLLDDAIDACPVPMDQRPSSQLKEVAEGIVSGWGGLDGKSYAVRLTILCGFFFTVIAYPIASETYNPEIQWTEAHVAAMLGSLVAVTAITLTIHNSWDYVRNRLLSATIEYEETGWYDGQVYVKTPEMLAKDRLDGTYVCGPVVERCKRTMLACGAGVFGCAFALNALDAPKVDEENFGSYTPQKAALLRDLGMGTYIDAGEGKRISQGDTFSRETANTYEPMDEDAEEEDDEDGIASPASLVSPSSSSSSPSLLVAEEDE